MNKNVNVYSFNEECYVYLGDYNKLQQENKQLKERISNIKDIVYNCSQNNYFYKYAGKYLKSEIIEQLTKELENGDSNETN